MESSSHSGNAAQATHKIADGILMNGLEALHYADQPLQGEHIESLKLLRMSVEPAAR